MQREQQIMTVGAQSKNEMKAIRSDIVSSGMICQGPLMEFAEELTMIEGKQIITVFTSLSCLRDIDKIGVVAIKKIEKQSGFLDFEKAIPGARSLVVLLAGMSERLVKLAGKQKAEDGTSYSFLQYQLLRKLIWVAHDLGSYFESIGYKSLPLADCSLNSFRTVSPYWEFEWAKLGNPDIHVNAPLAALAGLVEIGLSGVLLTPEFGPRNKFVFLLTTAELPASPLYEGPKLYRQCCRCAIECPAKVLDKDQLQHRSVAGYSFEVMFRNETRCRCARSLGMVPEEGPKYLGWQTPNLPIADEINAQELQEAISQKDSLQVIGYRSPCHTDIIVEKCLQSCPV